MNDDTIYRFFSYVSYSSGCWEWQGSANSRMGHGSFWDGSRKMLAHRWSYEFFIEEIPKGFFVCHHCDNACCVNPFHLFTGTQKDNMADCAAKGRIYSGPNHYALRTHCKNGHEFSNENTQYNKYGSRICRTCRIFNNKQRYVRKALKQANEILNNTDSSKVCTKHLGSTENNRGEK